MIEEFIDTINKYANEKIRITKGLLVLITLCAFVIGLMTGAVTAKAICGSRSRRKITCTSSAGDDFDADEYVRNLSFDDDEE